MSSDTPMPGVRRLMRYFAEIEDPELRALIAEAVAIKKEHLHNRNRPMQKYRDAVDAHAHLYERQEPDS